MQYMQTLSPVFCQRGEQAVTRQDVMVQQTKKIPIPKKQCTKSQPKHKHEPTDSEV